MTRNELWYFLIDGQKDTETGVVGNFYAYGNHCGDALERVSNASEEYNFSNQNLTEASCLLTRMSTATNLRECKLNSV